VVAHKQTHKGDGTGHLELDPQSAERPEGGLIKGQTPKTRAAFKAFN